MVLDRWPMIGRDDAIAELKRLLADADLPGVALAGKPGVGKSRLAREAAAAAIGAGWTVRSIAATATSEPIPLGSFARWTDDQGGAPHAMARRVVDALTAGAQPDRLLVFVDDAHQLDDLSALVVHQLVQSRAATVLVTIRTGEPTPAAVTALWRNGMVRRLDVQGLVRDETDRLLTAVFGATPDQQCGDDLWRLTQGNVLFLRQLVEQEFQAGRLVNDDDVLRWRGERAISGSLAELVDAQIGAVSDDVRDVVDLVAVSEPIDWYCLRMIADQVAIEHAEQRELVRTSGNEVYIGHPMYAEVRKSRCGPSRLRRLRGQVAIAMKDNGSSAQIMKRGLLWLESDLPADSEVLLAAARAAAALLDFGAAERLFTAAADVGAGAEARIPLAFSLLMTQKGERIPEVLAAVDADEATQPAFVNDVALRAANLLWPLRSPELSRQFIVEALETARGPLRCQLLVFRAFQLALAARPREVLATMAEVGYENLDDHGTVMGFVVETVAHGELGHPDRAVESAIAGNAALSSTNPGKHLRQMLAEFHTFALATAGRITEAAAAAQLHHSSQHAEPAPVRAAAASILGMAALAAGDLEAALRHLPAAVEMENDSHVVNSFPRMHVLRAQALARTGRLDAAEEALNTARAHAHPAYAFVTPTELLAEAWLAAVQMRTTEARGLARRAAEFAHHHDQLAREVWCLQTAVQFDDMTAAGRLAELATQVDGPRVAVAARYAAALSADDAGELHAVSAEFEAMGDLLTAADAAGQAATAYRRAGLLGSAMTAAAAAQRLATICGGATSPAIVAASHVPPFTHREREIAALVAQGLSNRQIAEAVSLSVRTVESHIYRSSTKAGVAGRSGLAAMMRSAGR